MIKVEILSSDISVKTVFDFLTAFSEYIIFPPDKDQFKRKYVYDEPDDDVGPIIVTARGSHEEKETSFFGITETSHKLGFNDYALFIDDSLVARAEFFVGVTWKDTGVHFPDQPDDRTIPSKENNGDIFAAEREIASQQLSLDLSGLDGPKFIIDKAFAFGDGFRHKMAAGVEIQLGSKADQVWSGKGDDELYGNGGNDTLHSGAGQDYLYGGNGKDVLHGGSDRDYLFGEHGTDNLIGRSGDDWLYGGGGNDRLFGGEGRDSLNGEGENDTLLGGKGADRLYGDAGRDRLNGGLGNDSLSGGRGRDIFVFEEGSGKDVIRGFQHGVDTLVLDSGLWSGNLNAIQVVEAFSQQDRDTFKLYFESGDALVFRGGSLSKIADDIEVV